MHFKDNQTIHSQIADYLRHQIFGNFYKPGDKLLPIREFAIECKVNPNTIVKVYGELENNGLIFTERTNGKYVTKDKKFIEKEKIKFIKEKTKSFINSMEECNINKTELIEMIKELENE